jgi:hypothetical protein
MLRKATMALIALLVFGSGSAVLAHTKTRPDYRGVFVQRLVSMITDDRTGAVNDAARPFTSEEKASFAASQPASLPSAPFRRGGVAGGTMVWIRLTEPGGKLIHINVEHVTSVRSDTQIPGARTQLDLASGKFQGVQEDAEHVMRLISATSGAREKDETADAAEFR